jgi:aminoglycoside phosphotransferase family enzyme/predicted kinase
VEDSQGPTIAFLSTQAAYEPMGLDGRIQRVDTHISIVWLIGDRAFKLKRAVRFSYVDFSTLERRRAACEAEIRLNRRTAPSLYLGVVAVTRDSHGLALGGRGEVVEWLVEMARFDQDTLFDRLAERAALSVELMEGLADAIARLHATAEPRPDRGGVANLTWVVDGNEEDFERQGAAILDPAVRRRLVADSRREIERHGLLLEARRLEGRVRWCHGDLHLRNVCLVDGRPTIFDAVEFNEDIACVDVLYDLAFLLMDLWRRRRFGHANAVFNEYFAQQGDAPDLAGLPLLPLFLSCRAAVRAKTSVSAAAVQEDRAAARDLQAAAREYLTLAAALLHPDPPRLVAIGGFSGSGKTTLARGLAPMLGAAPGAVVLRSDVIRKAMFGVAAAERLGTEAYASDISRRVYDTMLARARLVLSAGHSVVADAVHARPDDRAAIARLARDQGVPFKGFWIEGPLPVLASRLKARRADASDATVDVLERQIATSVGTMDWTRLDGRASEDLVRQRAMRALEA